MVKRFKKKVSINFKTRIGLKGKELVLDSEQNEELQPQQS